MNQTATARRQPETAAAATAAENPLTFATRFGQITLKEDALISFPHGLFGFRQCTVFGLAKLPSVEESPLMLMQCVDQPAIAFLVADPALLGFELKDSDREEALRETRYPAAGTQFLSIITLYDGSDNYYLTANLKAPVLIDVEGKKGIQYILNNKAYSTQHRI